MRLRILSFGLLFVSQALAQSADLFDRKEQAHLGHGWSWKLGGHILDATPSSSTSQWLVSNSSGALDTLHAGTWTHQGSGSGLVGIGHWWVVQNPVLWDRWSIELAGVRHAVDSEFNGRVAQAGLGLPTALDTLMDHGKSTFTLQSALHVHRAIEIIPDFFFDAHLGLGYNYEFGMESERSGADSSLFLPLSTPSDWRLAVEGGVGLGVRSQSGRFLRLLVNTDLVQLQPTAFQGGGAWDWMEGSYRPWQFSISWDLLKRRPAASCVGAPAGQPGRDLFDPKMRKKMRWYRGN
ncbi:MAG: hypothetical protein O3B45_00175 [Bacteroidetes bacterium]|nr:hypothetical protein [Bacteroidota bacterium]